MVVVLGTGRGDDCRWSGATFFPAIDGGADPDHVRAPAGTRIETPSASTRRWRTRSSDVIPQASASSWLDNIGLPRVLKHLPQRPGSDIGIKDGPFVWLSLKEGHAPTARLCAGGSPFFLKTSRKKSCRKRFPRKRSELPGRRHSHPDPQFRDARPDRVRPRWYDRAQQSKRLQELRRPHPFAEIRGIRMRICSRRSTRRRSTPTSTYEGRRSRTSCNTTRPKSIVSLS